MSDRQVPINPWMRGGNRLGNEQPGTDVAGQNLACPKQEHLDVDPGFDHHLRDVRHVQIVNVMQPERLILVLS